MSVPVLTADDAQGVLAEYFDLINYIKAERKRCGSLEAAVKQAVIKYQSGYEISEFMMNQKGVYETLFEQMTREEYIARQIEATAQVLTKRVTEQVTRQVTEQVTRQVTEQVTQQITEQVKKDDIAITYKMLLEAGMGSEHARQSIMQNYDLKEDELCAILK